MTDRHIADFGQRQVGNEYVARRAIQACTLAIRTRTAVQETAQLLADRTRFRFTVTAIKVRDDTLEAVQLLYFQAA